jgi:transcriptional regulator with XRE-family HTH domain
MKNFSEKILLERKKRGLNQTEFAKLVGKSFNTISLWELGKVKKIDMLTLEGLAEVLDKPRDYFFEEEGNINISSKNIRNNTGFIGNNISGMINQTQTKTKTSNIDEIKKKLEEILDMKKKGFITEEHYNELYNELYTELKKELRKTLLED